MSEFGRLGPSNFAGERPVLSENHIRTYWWCSPARIGMATMAPDRWTARCKGASFSASEACEAYDPTVRGRAGRLEHRDEQGKDLSFPCASPSPKLHRSTVRPTTQLEEADGRDPADRLERYFDLFRTLHGKGERLCPGGSFAAVLDAVSSPVQSALHSFTKMHLDWLEDVVREGVARGQFTIGEQRPRDVAVQIFASVQGALIPGRLISDPARHRCGRGRTATFFGLRCNGGSFPGGAPTLGSHDL